MIVAVGDVDVAGSINSHPVRVSEAGSSTGAVGRPGNANGAGKCGDVPGAGAANDVDASRIKGCSDGACNAARNAGVSLDRPGGIHTGVALGSCGSCGVPPFCEAGVVVRFYATAEAA